jgi:hypothetical protein
LENDTMFRTATCALLLTAASVLPVAAADTLAANASAAVAAAAAAPLASDVDWSLPAVRVGQVEQTRGALSALYVSLAALNVVDGLTTAKGLHTGTATEANPLLAAAAKNSGALWAVKAGSTAASILFAERLRHNGHRGRAMVVMILTNSVMATVAANNFNVQRHAR